MSVISYDINCLCILAVVKQFSLLKHLGVQLNFWTNFIIILLFLFPRTEIDGSERCVKWAEDENSKKMQVTVTQLEY